MRAAHNDSSPMRLHLKSLDGISTIGLLVDTDYTHSSHVRERDWIYVWSYCQIKSASQ